MRTLTLFGTVVAALAVAAPAHAAVTKTVTIKTGGFNPKNVTIATGPIHRPGCHAGQRARQAASAQPTSSESARVSVPK